MTWRTWATWKGEGTAPTPPPPSNPILPIGTVANVQDVSTTTSITMVEPLGVQTGDLLIACVGILTGAPVLTPPADSWVLIDTQSVGTNQINAIYYRYVKASDVPGTTSWVWSGAPSLPRIQGVIAAFRYVDPVSPIHAHGINSNPGAANTAVAYPTLPVLANDFVIGFALARPSTAGIQTVFTPPADFSEVVNACTNSGSVGNLAVEMLEQQEQSNGTLTGIASSVDQASNWATYLFALKPA